MPNIFKHFMRAAAEPYQFPDAEELIQAEELPPEEVLLPEEGLEDLDPQGERTAEPLEEPPEENPISFAQIQADSILEDARRQAEQLLEDSRQSARQEAEQVFAAAREDGHREGYGQGLAQARQEAAKEREEQAKRLEEQVERFLTQAGSALDRQMDQNIDELRDLALRSEERRVGKECRL